MALLSTLQVYVLEFFIMLVFTLLVGAGAAYYLLKVKKVRSVEEKIDYSNFRRVDAREYVKFDTIISGGLDGKHDNMGIIVRRDGTEFIAILSVTGYNYSSASAEERGSSMRNYLGFLNIIKDEPIQYRQSTKAVDLSERIEVHKERLEKIDFKLLEMRTDFEELKMTAKNFFDDPQVLEAYTIRLEALKKDIVSSEWLRKEVATEIEYMESISGAGSDSDRVENYIFTWNYDPDEYSTTLDKHQIYLRAINELSNKANAFISALAKCNCTARLMSSSEIMDLFRHHYHPVTADDDRIEDILGSNYNCLFVSSDSLIEIERERIDEEAFDRVMQERLAASEAAKQKRLEEIEAYEKKLAKKIAEETKDYKSEAEKKAYEAMGSPV